MHRDGAWLRAVAAAAALIVASAGSTAVADSGSDVLIGGAALRPFFRALASLERHRARQPVRILQIGDSHTANDAFSGRMRERLQARFGAAGRGWLPAGVPFKYYRPALVAVTETGWRHLQPNDSEAGSLLFGLDASVAEPETPGARTTLSATDGDGFDRIAVEFVAQPHGAPLALRIDNGPVRSIPTAAARIAPRSFAVSLPQPAHAVELAAPDAQSQQVLGWSVERRRPGIVYENHGTIGATVGLLQRVSPVAVSFELAQRHPALLIVAFGTNEGFREHLDLAEYATLFRGAVGGLARRAPGAAVLILGPPDGNHLTSGCVAAGSQPAGCDEAAACSWGEPRNLDAVRDIQRRVARQQGWAFWDWAAAMGGRCSIGRWLAHDPPWAMPDHLHLNKEGYAIVADALFSALMKEYDGWKSGRPVRR